MENLDKTLTKYFRGMKGITDKQVQKRVDFATDLANIVILVMSLIASDELNVLQTNNRANLDIDYYFEMFDRRFKDLVESKYDLDDYLLAYITTIVGDILASTITNIDDPYFLSEERAIFIAETETNTVINYGEYLDAVNRGMTHKQWLTQKDSRVRKKHAEVDDDIIGINEYFKVGGDLMLYPHDLSMNPNPSNVINCRCHIEYTE